MTIENAGHQRYLRGSADNHYDASYALPQKGKRKKEFPFSFRRARNFAQPRTSKESARELSFAERFRIARCAEDARLNRGRSVPAQPLRCLPALNTAILRSRPRRAILQGLNLRIILLRSFAATLAFRNTPKAVRFPQVDQVQGPEGLTLISFVRRRIRWPKAASGTKNPYIRVPER